MLDMNKKYKILIVDDSRFNRLVMTSMLAKDYLLEEACDGKEAILILQERAEEFSLVLLDIVMPNMDGFEFLKAMKECGWLDFLPVIMISSEYTPENIETSYRLGASELIQRPYDERVVCHRIANTIALSSKHRELSNALVDEVIRENESSAAMVSILSHIVETRNGESGAHVQNIRHITGLLLNELMKKTNQYPLSKEEMLQIITASSLHDIGKMSVPEEILNKPGKLTDEEFQIIKGHAMAGANMVEPLLHQENASPLIRMTYEICRWHHERYDGRGYPDGLKGDEIPIAAQVVSVADVYDALTSERVYKPPFSHEEAVTMILNSECGEFNPLLMDCLRDVSDTLKTINDEHSLLDTSNTRENRGIVEEMVRHKELTASERTLRLLEQERMKNSFYATLTHEMQFEYTAEPSMVSISAWGAQLLGLDEIIMDPFHSEAAARVMDPADMRRLAKKLRRATPEHSIFQQDCVINCGQERRWFRIVVRAMWSAESAPVFTGAIGKALDIHDSRMMLDDLERKASHDALTGLYNHAHAKTIIQQRMDDHPGSKFALVMIDLDHFKDANDTYGHQFGDRVLIYMAEKLRQSIRGSDIAVRVGGDEFLIFLEYKQDLEPIIQRIFTALCGEVDEFRISVSMGISCVSGTEVEYEDLFHQADQALYRAKQSGRGQYFFYDDSMEAMLSTVSPIESDHKTAGHNAKKKEG